MAVDAVTLSTVDTVPATDGSKETSSSGGDGSGIKKIDPNDEEAILEEGVGVLVPGMISNFLLLNNSLFNFAKEAIDEADQE